jgi:hypothetical protein
MSSLVWHETPLWVRRFEIDYVAVGAHATYAHDDDDVTAAIEPAVNDPFGKP